MIFLAVSKEKFAPELCIDLTLLNYVVFSSASTLLFASSLKKSDTCLGSTNPLQLELPVRSSSDVRCVATRPKQVNICERIHYFTSVLISSPDKPGVSQQAEYYTLESQPSAWGEKSCLSLCSLIIRIVSSSDLCLAT